MRDDSEIITAGCFGRVHGIKGQITIQSYTEPAENILSYPKKYAFFNHQWQPLKLLDVKITEKHILARIEGVITREQAAEWTNVLIGISKEQMPKLPEGEFYWHQLTGMQVMNLQHEILGVVKEILPTGSNDVLIVEGEKRFLIPWLLDHTVKKVDLAEGMIQVDWDADF